MAFVKIVDEQGLARDTESRALVATDQKALLAHRKKLKESAMISRLVEDINKLRAEVDTLKAEVKILKEHGTYKR